MVVFPSTFIVESMNCFLLLIAPVIVKSILLVLQEEDMRNPSDLVSFYG